MIMGWIFTYSIFLTYLFHYGSSLKTIGSIKRLSAKLCADSCPSSTPYLDAIRKASNDIQSPFFFPGHNRGKFAPPTLINYLGESCFKLDLPELDNTDNLHAPKGPLLDSLKQTASLFGARKSWYLVNGCTSGNHIAMMTMMKMWKRRQTRHNKDKMIPRFIIPRDCHKSVFDGLKLADAVATLLPCTIHRELQISLGISIDDVAPAIEDTGGESICGLVLTRPSYHGVMYSPTYLQDIIKLCHDHDIPVLIDESHGSHLKFVSNNAPLDSLSCGADFVVQSAHKTLNALSQCGLLHIGYNAVPDAETIVDEWFSVFTTTSPNSLLLASLDASQSFLSEHGHLTVEKTICAVENFKEQIRAECRWVTFLNNEDLPNHRICDPIRICLDFPGFDSLLIDNYMCEKFGIYCELNEAHSITYPLSIGSGEEELVVLRRALREVCTKINIMDDDAKQWRLSASPISAETWVQERSYLLQASFLDTNNIEQIMLIDKKTLEGKISAETISIYPPGIPLVVRGEVLTDSILNKLLRVRQDLLDISKKECPSDHCIIGCSDSTLKTINIYT